MTHLKFQGLVVGHTETRRKAGHPSLGPEPACLTERHFVDDIPEKKHKKCVVCAQDRADVYKVYIVAPGSVDRPRRSDCTAGQMDGEVGWWTTSGNIGLPPLARVMGVGRQQQNTKVRALEPGVVLHSVL